MSGCNLFENGKKIIEDYGPDLDELNDGDRVGVMRTKEVIFFFIIVQTFLIENPVILNYLYVREIWYFLLTHSLKELQFLGSHLLSMVLLTSMGNVYKQL